MNKITKIGVSALCGSLAAIASAQAGSMSVSGGATATWSSNEGTVTGNPIGMNSGLTFSGSGELDGGTAFTLTVTGADQMGYSSGSINMDVPGIGGLKIVHKAGGSGLDRLDDKMPTAWEETNGTSLGTGLQTVAGVGTQINVEWAITPDMLPDGMTAYLAYSPAASGATANDKGVGGHSAGVGSGWDVVVEHSGLMDGLNVFAGMSTIEQDANAALAAGKTGDRTQYAYGATYAVGSVTVGYAYTRDNLQAAGPSSTSYYENDMYGVSFNVSDDLSLSYGIHNSRAENNGNGGTNTSVDNEASSLQIAYTMGGASIKLAETSVDNGKYVSGTGNDRDGTTIALSLAF